MWTGTAPLAAERVGPGCARGAERDVSTKDQFTSVKLVHAVPSSERERPAGNLPLQRHSQREQSGLKFYGSDGAC